MSACKYKIRNTWIASGVYYDQCGEKKKYFKRGFTTKKEAVEWEKEYISKTKVNCNMKFKALSELYFEDLENRLKKTTIAKKHYLSDSKVLPFFKNLEVNQITAAHIRKWQNELIGSKDGYSATYLKSISYQQYLIMQLSIIVYQSIHAVQPEVWGKNADEMQIWTVEQFKTAMQYCKVEEHKLAFEIMFYAGLRVGEVLALTPADILPTKAISITKSVTRLHKEDIVSTPKTPKSIRVVPIPPFLYDKIQAYISTIYEPDNETRLFMYAKGKLNKILKRCTEEAELPKIRVHDLRHSHVSLLIEMGYNVLLISQRLGHEKVDTTMNTYVHLYPNKQEMLAEALEQFA